MDASDKTSVRPVVKGPSSAPSLWAFVRGVLFFALVGVLSFLAGRRWAEAYARYKVFHVPEASTPSLRAYSPAPEPAPVEESSDGIAKQPRAVLFRLPAPEAKTVLLGGSFNGFDAGQVPLVRNADGVWEATLTLSPGRYQYKFKVDGRWVLDPANPERQEGPKEASLLEIQ